MAKERLAVFILESEHDEDGSYIPCIAVEDKRGYYRTDWKWGNDITRARQYADEYNEKLGLSREDVLEIQASTMRKR